MNKEIKTTIYTVIVILAFILLAMIPNDAFLFIIGVIMTLGLVCLIWMIIYTLIDNQ